MRMRQLFFMIVMALLVVACGNQPIAPEPDEVQTSELDRVASLLDGFEVEERPLSFPAEAIQAKAALHLVTTDEQVEILIFEMASGSDFANAVTKLAEQGIDVAAEAPLSFAGTNGTLLFVVRNVAPADQQEDARWVVSEISGALAGEE